MITIEVNNNKCRLIGNRETLLEIQKAFKAKHQQAFWIRRRGNVQEGWDGMINYITDSFYFKIGLLPKVVRYINDTYETEIKFIDMRRDFMVEPKVPSKLNGITPRPYQIEAVKSIVYNKVGNIPYWFGVIDAATNAGKTLMMAMIYHSFGGKIPTLMLLKDGDLYEQFKREIPELVGKENFGMVRGAKEQKWGNFTIAMVQTLGRDINKYKNKLSQFGIVLVDEADEGDSATYKKILQVCYNSNVRVGLSGTIYMSTLKKDFVKNENLRSFFSDITYKITKKQLSEMGHSTPAIVTIIPGNEKPGIKNDYSGTYKENISLNVDRAMIGLKRLKFQLKLKRTPALVICRFHEHVHLLYDIYSKGISSKYRIELVHGDIHPAERKKLLEEFRTGKIDVLISSFIIKRGKNHPLIKYIQNAAATDSQETVSQIMGRGERKHDSKKKYYIDDFFDQGLYLSRHSKHRVAYYKKEDMKVNLKYY